MLQKSLETVLQRMDAISPQIREEFVQTIIDIESKQLFAVGEAARLTILTAIIGGFNLGMEHIRNQRKCS